MKHSTATFDVDAQKGFTPLCPQELPVTGGETLAPILNAMAELGRFRVGSKDAHSATASWVNPDRSQMASATGLAEAPLHWPSHCVVGTEGFELLEGLPHPQAYDFFVWKGVESDLHPFGACFHDVSERRTTGVIEVLQSQGIERVLVGGLAFDFCVKDTAIQLAKAGFEVIVVREACKAISQPTAAAATQAMSAAGVRIVETLEQLVPAAH
ncbi:isochorismatase family protein [Pseudomonas sp. HR96]|uniref:isochorismatase family protein n=1 Tax=Pseudomonas sp. HR96 TaxID=1027966 RepID=UPI002A74D4C2|nr:isochorismatase family protein [Pseudomonas sp. HR96]WPO98464.1 isochorismatase family protein [Pseudomonas sp. HR96]